jgi:hypothetical protein
MTAMLAACASGSGGGGSTTTGSGAPSSGGVPVPATFVIGQPAQPFVGIKPTATANSTVNGTTPAAAGTAFGLDQTVYSLSGSGLSGIPPTSSAQATITYTGNTYQLSVPFFGVAALPISSGSSSGTASNGASVNVDLMEWTYVLGGFWVVGTTTAAVPGALSTFESGFLTPVAATPFIGTATYTSANSVLGVIESVVNGAYEPVPVMGNGTLTANFGTNQITGMFSNMVATNSANQSFPWNGVTLNGSISGNNFQGSTQVTSAPANAYSLKSSATGFISGAFYGPQATEIGAVWSLYDGSTAATGIVEADGAPTATAPAVTPPQAASLFLNPNPAPSIGAITNPTTINAAAPATAGNSPAAPVLATSGGPSFSGTPSFPTVGTVFPLTQSVMQLTKAGLTVDSSANTGGATIVINPQIGPTGSSTVFNLNIPSLGISDFVQLHGALNQTIQGGTLGSTDMSISVVGLNYATLGTWVESSVSGQADVAMFVAGYETPVANLPKSGTATYSGTGNVVGNVYVAGQFGTAPAVEGDASLTANFSTGQVTGAFTNMQAYAKSNPASPTTVYSYPWNDVSVSASIAVGTTKFSGTTITTSQPASPLALKNGATGNINGGFYGPNAENLGAVWSLSNADGSGTALGVVGATKQ